jgi:hypothetical protein
MPPTTKPSDDIIEDDFEVDRWFDTFLRDSARASARHGILNSSSKDNLPEFSE